jgi:hypothetical protein
VRRYRSLLLLCVLCGACDSTPDPRQTNFRVDRGGVKAQYDPKSGRLTRLEVDTNKNGVIDTWTYQDGTRIDRIEIDKDENGKIDRWEHYVDGKLASVGTSTRGDGVEDEWAFQRADGSLERVETDTDRDGRVDKWEDFAAPQTPGGRPILRTVSMDPDSSGRPTRRLHYRADGSFERSETLTNKAPQH